jgi:hypothetical protein
MLQKVYIETSLNRASMTGTKKYGQFRGAADFVRLPLQKIVQQKIGRYSGRASFLRALFREVSL